jgi:hypothetical protein
MCLHSWGGDVAIFPPHHLRAGSPTRTLPGPRILVHWWFPTNHCKEEGAFCGSLHGCAGMVAVYYSLGVRSGATPGPFGE